jgi:outer membrane protein
MNSLKAFPIGLLAAFALGGSAMADDFYLNPNPASTWVVSIGGMAKLEPAYAGSTHFAPGFAPSLSWHKPGETPGFSAPDDAIDLELYQNKFFKVGVAGGLDLGRSSADSDRLIGVHGIKWTLQAGIFAEYWPIHDHFRTRIELLHGMRNADGLIANLSADWVQKFGQLTLSGGPRMTLTDRREMRTRFGITAADAASSIYTAYDPQGGLRSIGWGMAQTYEFNRTWTGTLYEHYDYLVGPAGNSPLVQNGGTRNQFTLGAGLVYAFNFGW